MGDMSKDQELREEDFHPRTWRKMKEVESRFMKRGLSCYHDDCLDLVEIRRLIGQRCMRSWCETRSGASYRTVSRRLRVADEIGLKTLREITFRGDAIDFLVAKSTPLEIRDELIAFAKKKMLTLEYAKEVAEKAAKPKPKRKSKPKQEQPPKPEPTPGSEKRLPAGWDEVGKKKAQPVQGEIVNPGEDIDELEFPSLFEIYKDSTPEQIAEFFSQIRSDGGPCPCCGVTSKPVSNAGTKKLFDVFWGHVINKVGKDAARRAFTASVNRLIKDEHMTAEEAGLFIVDRMKDWTQSKDATDEVKGRLHPRTWLSQGRYMDDPAAWNVAEGESTPASLTSSKETGLRKEQMRLIRERMAQ